MFFSFSAGVPPVPSGGAHIPCAPEGTRTGHLTDKSPLLAEGPSFLGAGTKEENIKKKPRRKGSGAVITDSLTVVAAGRYAPALAVSMAMARGPPA